MGTKYGGNYGRSLGLVRNAEERGNLHIRVCKRTQVQVQVLTRGFFRRKKKCVFS